MLVVAVVTLMVAVAKLVATLLNRWVRSPLAAFALTVRTDIEIDRRRGEVAAFAADASGSAQ